MNKVEVNTQAIHRTDNIFIKATMFQRHLGQITESPSTGNWEERALEGKTAKTKQIMTNRPYY